ncbi:MAG: GatB/YqeY domain-containing protein [Nitrospira sp.]|nr:GatB/YqeY domain-containing protein [Nitrospira sp.]
MSLRNRLAEDLKLAIKSRDQLRMDVIRLIKAAILNKELELKKDLDDAEMTRLMTTLIKQRRESITQYQKAGRLDLAEKEQQQVAIIETYLPQAVSDKEIETLIESVIVETDARSLKDMGRVIKTVMSRLAGRPVDGKRVSGLVRTKLS